MPSIDISEERGVRYLHFGSAWVQGAMRIARPWALELEYTRDMMLPLLLRPEPGWPASVFQAGLGAASITRFLYRHRPHATLTVAELLPDVVSAARQFFRLPDDPRRIRIHLADAHEHLMAQRARFDFMVLDAFDDKGRSGMADTVPFYMNCRERLAPRGLVAVNFLTRRRDARPAIARLAQAFGEGVRVLPPCEAGNVVALAAREPELLDGDPRDLREAARALKAATGLDLSRTLARMAAAGA